MDNPTLRTAASFPRPPPTGRQRRRTGGRLRRALGRQTADELPQYGLTLHSFHKLKRKTNT